MGKNSEQKSVICDAGPIIHLVESHSPSALLNNLVSFSRVHVEPTQDIELQTLFSSLTLHKGEQEALTLMKIYTDAILLTDDSAARLLAIEMKMQVHGTLGIVIRAIRKKKRTPRQVIDIINSIHSKSTLFIRPEFLTNIIEQIKSECKI